MEAHSVTFASEDDHMLRRVRSTGDIPDTEPGTARPSRTYRPAGHIQRRSEGQPHSNLESSLLAVSLDGVYPPAQVGGDLRDLQRSPEIPRSPSLDTHRPQTNTENNETLQQQHRHTGVAGYIMTFLGYQGPNAAARKQVLGLVWNVSFALVQFVVIIALLAYAAHHESPTVPGLSEWDACERPLGAWDSIWLVRVAFGTVLSIWGFKRDRAIRLAAEQRLRDSRTLEHLEAGRSMFSHPGLPTATESPMSTNRTPYTRTESASAGTASRNATVNLPHSVLYSRLSLFTSLISLSWFLTAHILEYTSTNTCRHTSPHLWWLTFGIICILYLMILEIFLLGLLVFILGPIIYVAWSLVLLCLGRHPLQNPFYIKPEIGKLSKSVVDQIPLVLYIPAPPEDSAYHLPPSKGLPIATPQPIYTYPPKSPTRSTTPQRRKRFAFLRRSDKGKSGDGEKGTGKDRGGQKGKGNLEEAKSWEDHWEASEYPFVRLEGNRAACAICLMDFEEPKRVEGSKVPVLEAAQALTSAPGIIATGSSRTEATVEEVRVDEITREDREQLQLEDAGEGAQPLRLLACGHVFHKTCLDPWLTDVSGRCPICQRPVELPEPSKKDKKRRRAASRTNSYNNSPSP